MLIGGRKNLIIILVIIIIGLGLYFLFNHFNQALVPKEEVVEEEISKAEVFDPVLLDWEEVSSTVPWPPRDSHSVVVYQNKLWLMGGLNGNDFVTKPGVVRYGEAPHFSDIWVSEDGIDWNLVTDGAPWGERRSIQSVIFQDKILVIPGWGPWTGTKNDIWSSEDGVHWNLINANPNFPPREGHQLIVFKDKLWLIGGVNYDKSEVKNDAWSSEDGINWSEVTSSAPWRPRWDHEVVLFKDELWLIGGMDLNDNVFSEIWSSEDGENWFLVTDSPPWLARQGHETIVFKDRIWILGRLDEESQGGGKNDVWFSEDGVNWEKTKKDPPWEGREDHTAAVFQGKIWIFGGMTAEWVWKNDIWLSR